ncbi:MAG: hypothetical protein WA120_00075 [Candidatus Hydromicrobium sp.]
MTPLLNGDLIANKAVSSWLGVKIDLGVRKNLGNFFRIVRRNSSC